MATPVVKPKKTKKKVANATKKVPKKVIFEEYIQKVKEGKSSYKMPKAYISHMIHTSIADRDWSSEKEIILVIIDPGLVNMGFRIEKRNLETQKVETIAMCRKYFGSNDDIKPASTIFGECVMFFRHYEEWFRKTHIIIIEKQVTMNYDMTRFGPVIVGYFATTLQDAPLKPLLIEMFSTMKTQVLADPLLLDRLGAKKWSVMMSELLLKERDDEKGLELLNVDMSKRDDMADCIMMPEAFLLKILFEFNFPFVRQLYQITQMREKIRKTLSKVGLEGILEDS